MTAADLIHAEIARTGSIPFERFMELALYAPECGYYTGSRDPFGKRGDFFTAEQLQPTFGILIAQAIAPMLGSGNAVLELAAGRGDMAPAFRHIAYTPADYGTPLPDRFNGVIFCNELFDAMPVHLAERKRNGWRERYVTVERESASPGGQRCVFSRQTRPPSAEVTHYLERYHSEAPTGSVVEVNLRAFEQVRRVSGIAENAWWVIIDYGYTAREWPRHAHGTLLSYRQHTAHDSILDSPGLADITAHVAWTPLEDALRDCGWTIHSFTTLARFLLDAGEKDQFASVFEGCDAREELRRRLHLKTLLAGMGETFRVLVASKRERGGAVLHK